MCEKNCSTSRAKKNKNSRAHVYNTIFEVEHTQKSWNLGIPFGEQYFLYRNYVGDTITIILKFYPPRLFLFENFHYWS